MSEYDRDLLLALIDAMGFEVGRKKDEWGDYYPVVTKKKRRPAEKKGAVYKKTEYSSWFNAFWALYPKKADKQAAFVSWEKLSDDCRNLAINDCEGRYRDTEKQYIPHPSTYLNGERWEDEIIKKDIKLKLPRENDKLEAFAKQNNLTYPAPQGKTYFEYRAILENELELKQ